MEVDGLEQDLNCRWTPCWLNMFVESLLGLAGPRYTASSFSSLGIPVGQIMPSAVHLDISSTSEGEV